MRLLNVNLENFRNIESASLAFETDRVFFIGPNGQGKTNLLEAIGMSSNLRSFRKSGTDGLVREESEQCRMFFRFSDGKGQDREILLSFRPKGESLLVDGEKLSKLEIFLANFFGRFVITDFVLSAKVRRKKEMVRSFAFYRFVGIFCLLQLIIGVARA